MRHLVGRKKTRLLQVISGGRDVVWDWTAVLNFFSRFRFSEDQRWSESRGGELFNSASSFSPVPESHPQDGLNASQVCIYPCSFYWIRKNGNLFPFLVNSLHVYFFVLWEFFLDLVLSCAPSRHFPPPLFIVNGLRILWNIFVESLSGLVFLLAILSILVVNVL